MPNRMAAMTLYCFSLLGSVVFRSRAFYPKSFMSKRRAWQLLLKTVIWKLCALELGGTPATTERSPYTHTGQSCYWHTTRVWLSWLITPSVQKLETTAQTPLGKRLIRKHTVTNFLVDVLKVLITEFTFHPHTSFPSLGIGRASVTALRVHTGSDRRAKKKNKGTKADTHKLLIMELLLTTCLFWLSNVWCINLSGRSAGPSEVHQEFRGVLMPCLAVLPHTDHTTNK